MNSIRKGTALLLALALSLSIVGSAFADTATSDTTETLSVANTVSMTAPASATYALGDEDGANGPDYSVHLVVTVLSSNNPSGLTVKAQVDPWLTGGGINVPTTKRVTAISELDCITAGQTLQSVYVCPTTPAPAAASGTPLLKAAAAYPLGAFASSATSKNIATSTGALANADIGVTFYVDGDEFPVGGTYTSAVHWTTVTNP